MTANRPRFIELCPVLSVEEVKPGIFVLRLRSKRLASGALPGQFVNIKPDAGYVPLLRRPFSLYRVVEESVEIVFNTVGKGTRMLSEKKEGDSVDVLGPLGVPYDLNGSFETAILVAGGLGVAPMPILTTHIQRTKKNIVTFLGGRSKDQIVPHYLENIFVSTDDGTMGLKGTVVDLLEQKLNERSFPSPKIFACGPNPMLRGLSSLAARFGIACEVSLESAMACGFGICQGCPVENVSAGADPSVRKYSLVCKEGPVFNSKLVVI